MNKDYVLTVRDDTVTIYEIVGGDTVCIYRETCEEAEIDRAELLRNALAAFAEIVEENQ